MLGKSSAIQEPLSILYAEFNLSTKMIFVKKDISKAQ